MGKHIVHFLDTGETLPCDDQENLLRSMEKLGRRGIPVGCRNGGCGVCKVQVARGEYQKRVMSRTHISESDEREGIVLACRIIPGSDLAVKVIGKMGRAFGVRDNVQQSSTGE